MVAVTGLPYPVTIAPAALDQLANVVRTVTPGNRCVVISDTTVAGHYGSRVSTLLGGGGGDAGTALSFPFSEQDKTRELWSRITDALLDDRYGRDTTLVALGGGVVGDVVGFVAATYMRGIPVIQVPTSLLAMVDACIGGKTGVDTRHGKNLVGAFHQPSAVIIDPLLLETLPANHLRAGFAEIIKHGVIADDGYFDRIRAVVESWPPPGGGGNAGWDQLTPMIARSVEIKASVVSRDEREDGFRKVLNFGHTIGHAIETATGYAMLHGEAIAIGMVAEARIAESLGIAAGGTAASIARLCAAASLPTTLPAVPLDRLLAFTRSDKKARDGRVEYALPERIGMMAGADRGWSVPVDDAAVIAALAS